jgi:hypothetical protein
MYSCRDREVRSFLCVLLAHMMKGYGRVEDLSLEKGPSVTVE